MIFNEPPLAGSSAAGRSYEAMIHALIRYENRFHDAHYIPRFAAFFAKNNKTGNAGEILRQKYPEISDRFTVEPAGHSTGVVDKLRHRVLPMSFHASPQFRDLIEKSATDHGAELLHVEQTWMAYAVPEQFKPDRTLLNVHFLMDTDETVADPPEGLREWMVRLRLLKTERNLLRQFRHIRVLSQEMAETVMRLHPSANTYVVPLPIEASDYRFKPRTGLSDAPVVSIIGSMFWPPSRNAARRILTLYWPRIKNAVPDARLQIVGRDAFRHFGTFHGIDGISVHENVPDIEPYFQESSVMLYAPEGGSGMKVKIQEAMLYGVPVVTNATGVEGLDVGHGRHVMLGESADEIVESAVRVLREPELAQTLSHNGRTTIEEQCNPDKILNQLIGIYRQIMRPDAADKCQEKLAVKCN